jgi:translation initiation factor 3 subunit K
VIYILIHLSCPGADLEAYVSKMGWERDDATGVISVPANPDNQISSTVVQEDIKLHRKMLSYHPDVKAETTNPELTKVISHAVSAH